jgi:hypothetical protein
MPEIQIVRELVLRESTEELCRLKALFFATDKEKEDDEKMYDYVYTSDINKNIKIEGRGIEYCGAVEMPIGILKGIIERSEKAGANFIAIEYHEDHGEYDIYALKSNRATKADISVMKRAKNKLVKEMKANQIKQLESTLKKLKGEEK